MEKIREVKALIGIIDLNSNFFDYMNAIEKHDASERIKNNLSHTVVLSVSGVGKLGAVIDIEKDCIHVREVGGAISTYISYLNCYCEGLARALSKNKISFCAKKDVIKKIGIKIGFSSVENFPDEFERILH